MENSDLAQAVLESKKYRSIHISVVERVCAGAAARYPKKKEALKAAKSELHSIHESFLQKACHPDALACLAALPIGFGKAQLTAAALEIMGLHASTRERLKDHLAIYAFMGQFIGADSTVMDIGCGFNPFALPLLPEQPKAYLAYDINTETIDLLNGYFAKIQAPQYTAQIFDAVSATPEAAVDVALLLKLLPLLQQQKKGRGFRLLEELRFQKAIVSFPLKSLGGREKGMRAFYALLMEGSLPSTLKIVDERSFSNEVFYVVEPR